MTRGGRHLVVGVAGYDLLPEEAAFLAAIRPAGVILFSRNIHDPRQLQGLIRAIRAAATPAPTIWLDQEGGRVQRLRDPFTRYPSAGVLAGLARHDPQRALSLAELAGRLCGQELAAVGVGVDCAPVLDLLEPGADPVIGDRAFGDEPEGVIALAGGWLAGLSASGVMGMGKHFPGHGAASVDSHRALPRVMRSRAELEAREWAPFRALLPRLPALMTAHLVATGVDPEQPATWSAALLKGVLRESWGYEGLVVSDALEMGALSGTLAERAERALVAGCDLLLCCTGRLADGEETLAGIRRGLERLPPAEAEASGGRIEATLSRHRIAPGDPQALLRDARYRERRALLEGLAEQRLAADPTEVGVDGGLGVPV